MKREDQEAVLRWAFREEHLAITEHARVEMAMESVSTNDVIVAGSGAEVVEEDRDRPQGVTKVVLGYSPPDEPLHLVVNVDAFESDLARRPRLVTVYRPSRPQWRDERTRG